MTELELATGLMQLQEQTGKTLKAEFPNSRIHFVELRITEGRAQWFAGCFIDKVCYGKYRDTLQQSLDAVSTEIRTSHTCEKCGHLVKSA